MDQVSCLVLLVPFSSPYAQQLAAFESLEHLHDMTLALFKVKERRGEEQIHHSILFPPISLLISSCTQSFQLIRALSFIPRVLLLLSHARLLFFALSLSNRMLSRL